MLALILKFYRMVYNFKSSLFQKKKCQLDHSIFETTATSPAIQVLSWKLTVKHVDFKFRTKSKPG
jgi:hypothetical protein